ncbi:MAG: hypothetical protein ABGW50_01565 [Thermococcus sp.]
MAGRRTPGIRVYIKRTFCTQILWSRECRILVEIPKLRFKGSYWTHESPGWVEELWHLIFRKGKLLKRRKDTEIYWLPVNAKEELKEIVEKAKKEAEKKQAPLA